MEALHRIVGQRTPLPIAAGVTVAATAAADLAAGGLMWHVATTALVAGLVAGNHLLLAGRGRGVLQIVSGIVVAQPAVHAATKFVPHGPLEHGSVHGIGGADVLTTCIQLTIAAAIVGMVTGAEQLVALAAAVFIRTRDRCLVHRPRTAPPRRLLARPASRRTRPHGQFRPGVVPRRGPPVLRAVV
ncbi:MAG: hypothetical protein AB7V44_13635 [Pseudonocardia sp.]